MQNILYLIDNCLMEIAVTQLLKDTVGEKPHLQIVHSFNDMKTVLLAKKVHMLLVDLMLMSPENLPTLISLKENNPQLSILVFCMEANKELYDQLYRNGVNGIVEYKLPITEMQKAIAKVFNNEVYIESKLLAEMDGKY